MRGSTQSSAAGATVGAFALGGAALLVLAGAAPAGASTQQQPPIPTSLVFDRVTVVDVEQGKLVPDQRVAIVGNRIRAAGSRRTVALPKGARVVDAQGKYLIPGLWDMHTHLFVLHDIAYPLLLANGVTGIRDMGTGVPLDTLRQWRREILAETRVGPPRQLFAGPMLDEYPEGQKNTSACRLRCFHHAQPNLAVYGPAHVRHVVDSLRDAGADFIKVHSLSPDTYLALVNEAHRIGIPFAGHLPNLPQAIFAASDSGQRTIEHFEGLEDKCVGDSATVERCQPIAERHRRNGTWNVLGPTAMVDLTTRATVRERRRRLRFWPDSVTRDWRVPPDSMLDRTGPPYPFHLDVAERAGLPLLIGTEDGPPFPLLRTGVPGFTIHDDLAIYVDGGLTPLAALQAVTLNPAKFLGATDSLGTVAAGKLADLVLLDANPLVDIWNTTKISAVIANGRYFDRSALDQLLADVQATAKRKP